MGSVPRGPGQTEGLISQPNSEKQGEGGLGVEFPEAVGAALILDPRAAPSWVPVNLPRGLSDFEKRGETPFFAQRTDGHRLRRASLHSRIGRH